MHSPVEEGKNPLKRSFSEISSNASVDHGAAADQGTSKRFNPRRSLSLSHDSLSKTLRGFVKLRIGLGVCV